MKLSHSFVSTWERCPKQAQHRYVLRDTPNETTDAIVWGRRVHEALDGAIRGDAPLGADFKAYAPYLASIAKIPGVRSEVKLGIRRDGVACDFSDPDVWVRGAIDVLAVVGRNAVIADWKTGKRREDAAELEVHALLAVAHNPAVHSISGVYVWLKEGRVGTTHDLSDTGRTWQRLQSVAASVDKAMREGGAWPANPNPLCGWCPVKTCKFYKERG